MSLLHPMSPYNSDRPVDARWLWVTRLADTVRHANDPEDDDWIRYGLRYLNQLLACKGPSDRERLAQTMPDMDAAYRLYTCNDKLTRAEVEARLLARQTVEEVAAACNLTVKTVITYEKIFFQVLGRLNARIFIRFQAAKMPPTETDLTENDSDILLKWFSYRKGPLFLEDTLRYFRLGVRIPERLDRASRAELEELVVMLQLRAIVLACILPFPKCNRALVIGQLAKELAERIPSLTGEASMPGESAYAPAGPSADAGATQPALAVATPIESPSWWSAMREAILAA